MNKQESREAGLDDLLEEWGVLFPGEWDNKDGPQGWYAVVNQDGIVAYFQKRKDAFSFRLDKINTQLNRG